MDTNVWPTKVNDYVVPGVHFKGRSQPRWSDVITKDLKDLNIRKELAHERVEWRRAILPTYLYNLTNPSSVFSKKLLRGGRYANKYNRYKFTLRDVLLRYKLLMSSHTFVTNYRFFGFKDTLMQIWKSPYMIESVWTSHLENFAFYILIIYL